MKTREEVEKLKASWRDDPCWIIEDTEGFEKHKDELLAYRILCESERAEKRRMRLSELSETLGLPGNTKLSEYVDHLEYRIQQLEERLEKIEKETHSSKKAQRPLLSRKPSTACQYASNRCT